ncbi:hypothetical protein PF010_g31398, partial [Phytophthora fragariae]
MCKADISFLLNPLVQAPMTPERGPTSPSVSLLHGLSPSMTSPERSPASFTRRRLLAAPYIAPLEKRRSLNKRARSTMSMAALCSECFSSSDEELSDASTAASAPHPRKTHTPPCQV